MKSARLSLRWRQAAAPVLVLLLSAISAAAQMAPTRTWEELKQETQRRVDKNLGPVGGVKSEDAREALSNIHSLDRDEWAAAWSAIGERYDKRAQSEESAKNNDAARDDYFWAFRYYTVARWPVPNSAGKQKAYLAALAAFHNYGKFLDPPVEIINVPFEGKSIRGYLRLPKDLRPAPMVLMINGTDSRKEDEVQGHDGLYRSGIGVVAVDMPGTGESPVKADVGSERIFSRVLDYLATRPEVDSKRIVAWGVSYGGHWSANLAYIERARLRGTVVQGGPIHDYYTAEWQKKSLGTPEYLFDLFAARAAIYGVESLDEFYAYGPRLSLKAQGFVGQPSAPMLVLNGEKDTQVPISDLYVLLQSGGTAKWSWVNPDGGHTGRSQEWPNSRIAEEIVTPWIKARLEPDSGKKMNAGN
ncbi:MAG TPA: alpha/beta fold hydrolase [Verrucomicrobiae bacterium]|nr:alpha/beta fold hydrolase [Verrucomicrobiae bacterium]